MSIKQAALKDRITVYLPWPVGVALRELSWNRGTSITALVTQAIENLLWEQAQGVEHADTIGEEGPNDSKA